MHKATITNIRVLQRTSASPIWVLGYKQSPEKQRYQIVAELHSYSEYEAWLQSLGLQMQDPMRLGRTVPIQGVYKEIGYDNQVLPDFPEGPPWLNLDGEPHSAVYERVKSPQGECCVVHYQR